VTIASLSYKGSNTNVPSKNNIFYNFPIWKAAKISTENILENVI